MQKLSSEILPSTLLSQSNNASKHQRDPKVRLLEKVYQIADELGLEGRKQAINELNLTELPSQKDNKSTFQLLCPIAGCDKVFIMSVYPRRVLFHSLQNHLVKIHKPNVNHTLPKSKARWELCRCCLKQKAELLLIDSQYKAIFSDLIQVHQLIDGSICTKCSSTLQHFSSFKQRIIRGHERLMTYSQEASDVVKEEPQETSFIFADNVDFSMDSGAEIKVEPTIFNWQLDEKKSESGSNHASLQNSFSESDCELVHKSKRKQKIQTKKKKEDSHTSFLKDKLGKRIKYQCDQCDLTFLLESRLKKHKIKVHSKGIFCPDCQSEFSSLELMRQHSRFVHRVTGGRTAYKKRNYDYELCTYCGKQVRHDLMKSHIDLVHFAEKNIICTDCGKAFLLPIYLKTHRQVHHSNGVRPFICDFCGKGSFTKRLLIIHIKRHHTVKVEVRCNLCLKGFFTKQDLKRHLRRMHDPGEEDEGLRANLKTNLFHCPFCSRTYQGMRMCQMHMKASHPGQIFDKVSNLVN